MNALANYLPQLEGIPSVWLVCLCKGIGGGKECQAPRRLALKLP